MILPLHHFAVHDSAVQNLLSADAGIAHNRAVQTRFLLGPAGSGKTHRCLAEIRAELRAAPEGLPLLLLAPKQATFQLERQLLSEEGLSGYSRLQILSFDRLAQFLLEQLAESPLELLDEEGRIMVLRALLNRHQHELTLFHATARLPGFARQLNLVLRELQHYQLSPGRLTTLAEQPGCSATLRGKLRDLSRLLGACRTWLKDHHLQDADGLLGLAAELAGASATELHFGGLWLDGFAEMTPQELDLLAVLIPRCQRATLAFCLESIPQEDLSWLSTWSVISQTFRQCHRRVADLPGVHVNVEQLPRDPACSRFATNPVLAHLERHWSRPVAFPADEWARLDPPEGQGRGTGEAAPGTEPAESSPAPALGAGASPRPPNPGVPGLPLQIMVCAHPAGEAVCAAREILRYVRQDPRHRFREVAVLVRSLDNYHHVLARVFTRFGIPYFLDRREPVAHHPLAELTRGALRTVALGWKREDWFGALKTGLVPASDDEIDRLENEALGGGWEGAVWRQSLAEDGVPRWSAFARGVCQKLLPPFLTLEKSTAAPLTGPALAEAVREFWRSLEVERRLEQWSAHADADSPTTAQAIHSVHISVWNQMRQWLENVELAFSTDAMPLSDWLPILEAGLSNLTVGVIPPALDQVLVGAIDRSRNPDLQLALVLGLNEAVFPAPPAPSVILTESDRAELENHRVRLGPGTRHRLGHERFYGYIACTRPRQRLVLTYAAALPDGRPLNPSPFVAHLRRLFPRLRLENSPLQAGWAESEHPSELLAALMPSRSAEADATVGAPPAELLALPAVAPVLQRAGQIALARQTSVLSHAVVTALYGRELRLSVSALEDYAACPFRFFVHKGLRGQEREEFDLGRPEEGSFQHKLLSEFHQRLRADGLQWRDLTPTDAAARLRRLGAELLPLFEHGLFNTNEARRFRAWTLIEELERWLKVVMSWMPNYQFNPTTVELAFGSKDAPLPAWRLPLADGRALLLRGRIDRIDLCPGAADEALVIVMDYKSSGDKLDPVLLEHGLELQLLSYLGYLRRLDSPREPFGVARLVPAGVFYVNLRGDFKNAGSRSEALDDAEAQRQKAYRHFGRFDKTHTSQLDRRSERDHSQFQFHSRSSDPMESTAFSALLDRVEQHLTAFAHEILAGRIQVDPYRKGEEKACDHCAFRSICRFDPWLQPYRVLRPPSKLGKESTG